MARVDPLPSIQLPQVLQQIIWFQWIYFSLHVCRINQSVSKTQRHCILTVEDGGSVQSGRFLRYPLGHSEGVFHHIFLRLLFLEFILLGLWEVTASQAGDKTTANMELTSGAFECFTSFISPRFSFPGQCCLMVQWEQRIEHIDFWQIRDILLINLATNWSLPYEFY